MRTKVLVFSSAVCLAAAACWASDNAAPATDSQAVEQAAAQFYAGLNAMFTGDAGPMQEIWSHADDVTYMGPGGGITVGWNQVRQAWDAQAGLKLGGNVEPTDTHVTVGDGLAFTQCLERGSNLNADGNTVQVSIRATNVFRKENGQWKMIGHHTDLLPFLEEQTSTKSK
jgi:ketosteroid isomerase-like protein